MSQYATLSDLTTLGLPAAALSGIDDATRMATIVAASETADSYLGKRFALPLIAWGLRVVARLTRLAPWRAQAVGLVVMGACGLAVRTYWLTSIRGAVPNRTWFPLVQLGYWLPCYLDWFAVGMLLAVASARVAAGGGPTRVLPAIARRAWVCWGLAAIWVWVITRSGFPTLPWRTFGAWEAWWWDLGALAVGTFLVLPALVPGPRPDLGRRVLASPTAVLLGTRSEEHTSELQSH